MAKKPLIMWCPAKARFVATSELEYHRVQFKVDRVCQLLDISRPRFNELVRQGKLRTVRLGERAMRVASDELERFIRTLPRGID